MFFVVGDKIPKIKFTYFNGRGLGEISRLILAQAGVEFEDQRLTPDEWKKLKSSKCTVGKNLKKCAILPQILPVYDRTEFTEYRSFGSVLFGSIKKYRTKSFGLFSPIF